MTALESWLDHPAVQAAGLPFIVALIVTLPLARTRWLALAQIAGFVACATLVAGWSLESLTSTRKLAIIGVASIILCVIVETWAAHARATVVASLALAFAALWMAWRVLAQKEPGPAIVAGVLAFGYVALQCAMTLRAGEDPVRAISSATVLALTSGIVGVLGASAVLGSLAIAAGASAGATLAYLWMRNLVPPRGRSLALPASAIAALVGVAAVLVADLPAYCLAPLLLVTPAARFAPALRPMRTRAVIAFASAIIPAAAAIALAWFRPA